MQDMYRKIYDLQNSGVNFAIATIVSSKGSVPRNNAKMIVLEDKTIFGTIGGGYLEFYTIEESVKSIQNKTSMMLYYRLNSDGTSHIASNINSDKKNIEMLCGGEVDIFVEYVSSKQNIYLIGGGHVNLALSGLINFLGLNYYVVEDREDFRLRDKYINANFIVDSSFDNAIKKIKFNKNDIVIIATSKSDEEAFLSILKNTKHIDNNLAFFGMIGSKNKVSILRNKAINTGLISKDILDKILSSPIGLDLGGESPECIALSIMSLILIKINNASGKDISLGAKNKNTIVVRGAGDIATGTIKALKDSGFNIIALEIEAPTVIRSTVSLASALYEKEYEVEHIKSILVDTVVEAINLSKEKNIVPILIDREMATIKTIKPFVLIDATISKINRGITKGLADIVICLGPGFDASKDCDYVIETMRGHTFATIIDNGYAIPNTAVPANISGESILRVIKSPKTGIIKNKKSIGDIISKDDVICIIESHDNKEYPVKAQINGVLRGLIRDGFYVTENLKIADIDPRGQVDNCFTISDKSRTLGYAVLSCILKHENKINEK